MGSLRISGTRFGSFAAIRASRPLWWRRSHSASVARPRCSVFFRPVLLAPLPYEQPGQLVRFYQQEPDQPATRHYLTGAHFSSLREHAASFENVAALDTYSETGRDLVKDGHAQRLRMLQVTSDYFDTLRSNSLRGPGFDRRDEVGTRRVVLSDALVARALRRRSVAYRLCDSVERRAVRSRGHCAAGLRRSRSPAEVEAWIPYNLARDTDEENNSLTAVGRLRGGVSLEQARAELAVLSRSMKERWPAARLSALDAVPLQEDLVATARGPLHLLFVAVLLVLVVACVNVANLQLARASARVHEFATRVALGSGTRRLVRQLFVESLFVAGLGGLVGLALASSRGPGAAGMAFTPFRGSTKWVSIHWCWDFLGAHHAGHGRSVRCPARSAFRACRSHSGAWPAIALDHGYAPARTPSQRACRRSTRARAHAAGRRRRAAGEFPSLCSRLISDSASMVC